MKNKTVIQKKFSEVLERIWNEKIIEDYNNDFIFREDSIKMRLYKHILDELEELFIKYNVRLHTEYTLDNLTADMVLLDLDNNEPLSIIELKAKLLNTKTIKKIKQDYEKMEKFQKKKIK